MRFTIRPATFDELDAACRLLSASRSGPLQETVAARYRDLLITGEFDPQSLFIAVDEHEVARGAMLVQALPGAIGLAWPPRAKRVREAAQIEDALADHACAWLRGQGVKVCQAFGLEADRRDFTRLLRHGFRCITQVTHRRRDIDPVADSRSFRASESPVQFEPFAIESNNEAISALLATYEGSRDCPELGGARTPEELLAGLADPFPKLPRWHSLARHGVDPAGVLLLGAGTEPGVLELNYLGLVPFFRGRGWSAWLVRFAIGRAVTEGCHTLALSVDVRNEPAIRLYDRFGFRESERRDVYLAAWPACS